MVVVWWDGACWILKFISLLSCLVYSLCIMYGYDNQVTMVRVFKFYQQRWSGREKLREINHQPQLLMVLCSVLDWVDRVTIAKILVLILLTESSDSSF